MERSSTTMVCRYHAAQYSRNQQSGGQFFLRTLPTLKTNKLQLKVSFVQQAAASQRLSVKALPPFCASAPHSARASTGPAFGQLFHAYPPHFSLSFSGGE